MAAGGFASSCSGQTLAAGNSSSVALKGDGSVWTWGGNWAGQLGNGSTADSPTPVQVQGLSGPPNAIAAGYAHVLAAMPDGSVWAWGDDQYGELGDGNAGFGVGSGTGANRSTPVQVLGPGGTGHLSGVTQVAAGYMFSVALKSDGTVWQWGSQLGSGSLTPFNTSPVQVSGLSSVFAIAAPSSTGSFAMALRADGTVWTWGLNAYGNLGNGTTTNSAAPVQVLSSNGSTPLSGVASIAAGRGHALGVKGDGTVWGGGQDRKLQVRIANNGTFGSGG